MVRSGIIVNSLILTILIFAFGILVNYGLDFVRIDTIADVMTQHEIDTTAYLVEQEFTDLFGGNRCEIMNNRIANLKEEIRQVGADLGTYSRFSFFKKKDYDYLKRKYFLLELRFLTLIEQLNKECNRPYIPIVFFYEIDDDASERQGFILEDISKEFEQEVVVLALDKDYEDEPLVQLLAAKYNVTIAPTIILADEKKEGLVSGSVLRASIRESLKRADPYGQAYDFTYVLNAAGRDVNNFAANLSEMLDDRELPINARADIMLALGRITKNDVMICDSLPLYDFAINSTSNIEKQALLYETVASIDCGRNRQAFLKEAAVRWKQLNNSARTKIIESLATGKKLNLKFDTSEIKPVLVAPERVSRISIGENSIMLQPGDRVLTQVDRVKRDWLGLQLEQDLFGNQILTTFSERLFYNVTELRPDIGWHEGGRMSELIDLGIEPVVAYGTLAARLRNRWFAVDDQGVFRFEVPLDKLLYPTTRFLRDDLVVLMDTHGVNMLVEQSIRNKVDAVVSDCDHPGKIKAAKYLSDNGIPVACYPDRFMYLALGHNISLIGSPPINKGYQQIIIGAQPVQFAADETIVVMNSTDKPYALWYYQTPTKYFTELQKAVPSLDLKFVQIDRFDQMFKVVNEAQRHKADVIAARVFNKHDYDILSLWLQQSPRHRAVLFHSAQYPYGYLLLKEYPHQTAFDDPNPRFLP